MAIPFNPLAEQVQRRLKARGHNLGTSGPAGDGVDGMAGNLTFAAVLAEIPDDRRVAEAYSRGELMVDALPEYRTLFERLLADIVSQLKDASGVHPCSGDQARDRSFLCSGSGVR